MTTPRQSREASFLTHTAHHKPGGPPFGSLRDITQSPEKHEGQTLHQQP